VPSKLNQMSALQTSYRVAHLLAKEREYFSNVGFYKKIFSTLSARDLS
jgi:hypothetical protein